MEKKLEHEHAIACEVALEGMDVLEPLDPNVLRDELRWKLLPLEELAVDPHDYDFFVMGSIEYADLSSGPGRTVYIAGQLGLDASGKLVGAGDFRAQATQAFENLKAAVAEVGAEMASIVKINNYLVDIGTNIAAFRELRDRYFNISAPPASTPR
jgi:enamine deaminase RidA (YjgF/YER057c/UK114 family)